MTQKQLKLDTKVLSDRLRNQTRENYIYIYSIMKGVTLGVGAFVLITFLDDKSTIIPRFCLWLGSFSIILISHTTTARGNLLTGYPSNLLDTILPLTIGFVEFLLFAILKPSQSQPNLWFNWLLVASVHGFLASIMVQNRIKLMKASAYCINLRPLLDEYQIWLKTDRNAAIFFGFISLVMWLAVLLFQVSKYGWAKYIQSLIGAVAFVGAFRVITIAENQKRRIADYLLKN